MNRTLRRITIGPSEENGNARDLIRVNRELDSNEIDSSTFHRENYGFNDGNQIKPDQIRSYGSTINEWNGLK
jgi:hypothetical protein